MSNNVAAFPQLGWGMTNFDRMHILVQWGGKLPGGEEWSNSLRMANNNTGDASSSYPDSDGMQDLLENHIAPTIQAYHTRPLTHVSGAAKLSFAKANIIKMDGHYLDNLTHEFTFADIAGAGSGNLVPNQVALVVSLITEYSRGPAHRGRYYLPLPAVSLSGTTGQIAQSEALDVANSSAEFLTDLSDTPGIDINDSPNVVIMSRKAGAPATHVPRGVSVGRILDTQRRRRTNLAEDYQTVAVDFGA